MRQNYLFDTGVFIAHFRHSNPAAAAWISRAIQRQITAGISAITSYELWQGVFTEEQLRDHKILLTGYRVYDVNEKISQRAAAIYRGIPAGIDKKRLQLDILIAATAEYHQLTIVTLNTKDFARFDLKNSRVETI